MPDSRIETSPTAEIKDADALSRVYTPGVADACRQIAADPAAARRLTARGNCVAVVSDGSAVLGLGDVGPLAALPILEGKAALYKRFAGIDAWPLCLDARDVPHMVECIRAVAGGFGGVSVEDVAAPRCFDLERQLRDALEVPVFHDDQHGTAVVVLGALTNALQVTGKRLEDVRIVMSGAGAAGTATVRLLQAAGADSIAVYDSHGPLHPDREDIGREDIDQENQINNVLAFPGIFRDLLDGGARELSLAAQHAAAQAIADAVADDVRDPGHIVPDVFDEDLVPAIARAVTDA